MKISTPISALTNQRFDLVSVREKAVAIPCSGASLQRCSATCVDIQAEEVFTPAANAPRVCQHFVPFIRLLSCVTIAALVFTCGACSDGGNGVVPVLEAPKYYHSNASWSPTDTYVAYQYNFVSGTLDSVGLYLFDLNDSTFALRFGANPQIPSNPDFSPDGQWMAFSWYAQIWVAEVLGDSLKQLSSAGSNFSPSWSPDGNLIAFRRSAPAGGVYLMLADGSESRWIASGNSPVWLSNSTLAIIQDGIVVADTSRAIGGTIVPREGPGWIGIRDLTATRDGSRIAFSAVGDGTQPNIWVANANGSGLVQLTSTGGDQPAWSADGTQLVYTNTLTGEIWTMNSDGSDKAVLIRFEGR